METLIEQIIGEKSLTAFERTILCHLILSRKTQFTQVALADDLGLPIFNVKRAMRRLQAMRCLRKIALPGANAFAYCLGPPDTWRLSTAK